MKLVRYNPFNELNLFNHFFNDSFFNTSANQYWAPAADIIEKDGKIVLNIEVPGVKKEDINVNLSNKTLTISGERKFEQSIEKDSVYRKERTYGSFKRMFALSDDIMTDEIEADYNNGILTITLKKDIAREEVKQITVN